MFLVKINAYIEFELTVQLYTIGTMDERPLFFGLYLIVVNKYKTITIPSNSFNPEYHTVVAQAKL